MPDSLAALVDYGIIQQVVRPLMSGKEAQVYLVVSEGEERVAKVYKEAQARTFKHRAEYTEGRKTRSSRDQRAIRKRTRHGRAQDEAAWRSTEVEMIYRLRDAGVRVPEPYQCVDGVLVMELIKDAAGNPAPRLGDLTFESKRALEIYQELLGQVVRMLCAGVVHGDFSDFNVLMGVDGPVMIDFPQAVDPARNQNARRLLIRDVDNLHRFVARFAPHARRPLYAQEMWELYQGNRLEPTTKLAGGYRPARTKTDTTEVLMLIDEAGAEERARREARGEELAPLAPKPLRTVVDLTKKAPKARNPRRKRARGRGRAPAKQADATESVVKSARSERPRSAVSSAKAVPSRTAAPADPTAAGERKRRRRRRRERTDAPRSGASAAPQSDAPKASAARPPKKRARRRSRPA